MKSLSASILELTKNNWVQNYYKIITTLELDFEIFLIGANPFLDDEVVYLSWFLDS